MWGPHPQWHIKGRFPETSGARISCEPNKGLSYQSQVLLVPLWIYNPQLLQVEKGNMHIFIQDPVKLNNSSGRDWTLVLANKIVPMSTLGSYSGFISGWAFSLDWAYVAVVLWFEYRRSGCSILISGMQLFLSLWACPECLYEPMCGSLWADWFLVVLFLPKWNVVQRSET